MTRAELADLERRVARMEADAATKQRVARDAPIVAKARQMQEAHVAACRAEEAKLDRVLGLDFVSRASVPRFDPVYGVIRLPNHTPAAARAIAARAARSPRAA